MNKLFTTLTLFFALLFNISTATAGNKETAEDLYRQGVEFLEKGQYIRSIAKLEQANELNPDWRYLEPLAEAQTAQNEVAAAVDTYENLLKKAGTKLPVAKRTEIRKEIERLKVRVNQQAHQDQAKSHYRIGSQLQQDGKMELAIIEFERAYELSGEFFIKRNIAVIELALGNKARALSEFQKYLKYGNGQISDRDQAAVEAQIRRLQSEQVSDDSIDKARVDIKKARGLIDREDFDGAYRLLEKSYKTYQYYDSLQYMGRAAQGMKQHQRALYFYKGFLSMGGAQVSAADNQAVREQIAKITPMAQEEQLRDQALQMAEQGQKQLNEKEFAAALASYEQAYRFRPEFSFLKPIGEACEGLSHDGRALSAYEKFLDDGGSNVSATDRDVVKKRISRLKQKNEESHAEENGNALFNEGMAAYNAKNYALAAEKFEAAYNTSANYSFLNWYAESAAALKQYEKAVALYTLYIEEGGRKLNLSSRNKAKARIGALKEKLKTDVDLSAVPRDVDDELSDLIHLPLGTDNELARSQTREDTTHAYTADGTTANQSSRNERSSRNDGPPRQKKWVWAWVAMGVAVIGTAGAITTGAVAANEQKKIDVLCPDGKCPQEYITGAIQKEQDVHDLKIVRNVSIAVGVTGLAAMITLFIVEPRIYAKHRISLSPAVSEKFTGLTLLGQF